MRVAETIAAISTPAGEGAIAMIRVSGGDAVAVADLVFRGKTPPSQVASHTQHFGAVVNAEHVVDQVMLAVHRAPHSYTGEDLVEITCHGGVLVTAKVLETCLAAGARAARPGEFTERAFLNGKLDLTQAEAVMDLIRAQTDLALRSAAEQLEGRLGNEISGIRRQVLSALAHVEAAIDFPDEDIEPADDAVLAERLTNVLATTRALLATADEGRILREGLRVVIYGPTNAGKSSLLNRLLGYERAIVSETPGTTRDTIEEVINIRGVALRLTDTAGVRESGDAIEREGIARTEKSLAAADLVLQMFDASAAQPTASGCPRPGETFQNGGREEIMLLNKADLPEHADWRGFEALRISCVAPDGLRELEEAIIARISARHLRAENGIAINRRHRDCLNRAAAACEAALGSLGENGSAELVAVGLRETLN